MNKIRLILAGVFGAMSLFAGGSSGAEDSDRWVALETLPARLDLENRFEYAQLLVTAIDADGRRRDVTREVELSAPDFLRLDARGLVRPTGDGIGELRIRLGELEAVVPVQVRGTSAEFQPSFVRDVMPQLAKHGCNSGTCHGAAKGRNGFQLSLRGYDPIQDHRALTDDLAGRRFNRSAPERSLFLLKPTAEVPHQGGQVLEPQQADYELLRSWVASGVPSDVGKTTRVTSIRIGPEEPALEQPGFEQQFAVWASYDDGSERDVTAEAFLTSNDTEVVTVDGALARSVRRGEAVLLARYEGSYASRPVFVMGNREGFTWKPVPTYGEVDRLVYDKLQSIQTLPSEVCTDAEYLRRVMLDLTGLVPTLAEVRGFLADSRDSRLKREELVDRLIGSPDFIEHWTNKWSDLLQVNRKFLGEAGAQRLRNWIYEQVASNRPYDQFVEELLTASGPTTETPPVAYYKVLREADVVMENTTQLFLGVRFSCNKCHDHPFERWTQNDHWQLAAYFAQVGRTDIEGSPKMPRNGTTPPNEPTPAFEERIFDADEGEVTHPGTGQYAPPRFPYEHGGDIPSSVPRREQLSAWLTAPENPYFARSFANRLWSYFLGVGLIDPVDDIRASNPPSNPALLTYLTGELLESGFDVRHVMRLIVTSRTYQHGIEAGDWNRDDTRNYSHCFARRLPAETLYDAIARATGSVTHVPGYRHGTRAAALLDPAVPVSFLDLFGRPPRESACECERVNRVSLGQALNLVNGETLAGAIEDPNSAIVDLVRIERNANNVIDELYIRFLGRPATADEQAQLSRELDPTRPENIAALKPDQARDLQKRWIDWEMAQKPSLWQPVSVRSAATTGGATLEVLEDGSLRAGGENPERVTYDLVLNTNLTGITGVRLEALPDDGLPAKGPGRAENGNFVLHELRVIALGARSPLANRRVAFSRATASFSQEGWPVAQAIQPNDKGWAVSPQFGRMHQAAFESKDDIGFAGGTQLVVKMVQNYGGQHTLGRFRLQVTQSPRPVRVSSLPANVQAALQVPREQRTAEQQALSFRQFIATDKPMTQALRLATAQDLVWALATSPAFLFNR